MERFIHDDRTGLDYELVGDCYLIAGEDEPASPPLGLWGRRRADYLKQHRRILYYALLYDGKLNAHLSQIDQQARQMADQLTAQLARTEGVTESLKAADPLVWVQRMNSIQARVREVVTNELIYT